MTLIPSRGDRNDVDIEIKFRPTRENNGDRPEVRRVDLIIGQITGPNPNLNADTNRTTKVVARFGSTDWHQQGSEYVIKHAVRNLERDLYARVPGTAARPVECPQMQGRALPPGVSAECGMPTVRITDGCARRQVSTEPVRTVEHAPDRSVRSIPGTEAPKIRSAETD